MKRPKPHFMHFGPAIPIVPVGDFSVMPFSDEQWEMLWSVCGPSVELNMRGRRGRRGRKLELWQVIAAAYLEGLAHGAGIGVEAALK
jgi:hypothetical protein